MEPSLQSVSAKSFAAVSRSELVEFLSVLKPSMGPLASLTFGMRNGKFYAEFSDRLIVACRELHPLGASVQDSVPRAAMAWVLFDIVKGAPGKTLELDWDKDRLVITSEGMSANMPLLSDDCRWRDLPSVTTYPIPKTFVLDGIASALQIAEEDSPRNYGTIVQFSTVGSAFSVVATDGFRLTFASHREPVLVAPQAGNTFCLPVKCCKHLHLVARLAERSGDPLRMGVSEDESIVLVQDGPLQLFMRTSAIKYPAYESVIPKTREGFTFDRKALLVAAKPAAAAADRKSRMVLLSVQNGRLSLRARKDPADPWQEYSYTLTHDYPDREEVAINGSFLVDALQVSRAKLGTMFIAKDPEEPMLISMGIVSTVICAIRKAEDAATKK